MESDFLRGLRIKPMGLQTYFFILQLRGPFNDPIYKAWPFSTSKVSEDTLDPPCSFGITEGRASKGEALKLNLKHS